MSDEGSVHSERLHLTAPASCASMFSSECDFDQKSSIENSKSLSRHDDGDTGSCSDAMSLGDCNGPAGEPTNSSNNTFEVEEENDEPELNQSAAFAGELVVDRLLQRILTERMFELRRIRHGNRPVTGSRSRETLDNFFSRALNPSIPDLNSVRHRPESVQDEVQSLAHSSFVSSALHSEQFRQTLERTLRGNVPAPDAPRIRRIAPASVQPSRVLLSRQQGPPSLSSIPPSRTFPQRAPSPAVPPPTTTNAETTTAASISSPEPNQDGSYLNSMLTASLQLLTESVNADLNDLQGLRIVHSVLNGTFRRDLENVMENRLSSIGGGAEVRDYMASLARPSTARRVVPVPSTEAHGVQMPHPPSSVPRGVTNSQLASTVYELQSHVTDMKRMLGLMFEMQMDTQRAVRQEVAAVFTAFMETTTTSRKPDGESPVAYHQVPRPTCPVNGGVCTVCLEQSVDTILYKCGHLCVCHLCGLQLKMKGLNCPICRAPILDVIRAFQTQ